MKLLPLLLLAAAPVVAGAAGQDYRLTLRDHQFAPAELQVPAGTRIKLLIDNRDASAEEFESFDLNREKVIPGNTVGFVYIGPLDPGRYQYFGDFHQKTAHGTLIAQ